MTDATNNSQHCCQHYPNRVLDIADLAFELKVCVRTISNLMKTGGLPEPTWFNSMPRWMLYDVHAFISSRAGLQSTAQPTEKKATSAAAQSKKTTHKAGKYRA